MTGLEIAFFRKVAANFTPKTKFKVYRHVCEWELRTLLPTQDKCSPDLLHGFLGYSPAMEMFYSENIGRVMRQDQRQMQ